MKVKETLPNVNGWSKTGANGLLGAGKGSTEALSSDQRGAAQDLTVFQILCI
jgi:hypothetical protein